MSPEPAEAEALVAQSVRAYEKAYAKYERRHPEIFNPVEQERLRGALALAAESAGAETSTRPRALDLGCGTGNLTAHLLDLGFEVVAADVSPDFLRVVTERFDHTGRLETLLLNGHDLSNAKDGSFDLVAAYSVLHHIPDYLAMVDELARVLRSGGVAYVDHEVNERFWEADGCVSAFRAALDEWQRTRPGLWNPHRRRWQRFLMPSKYAYRVRRLLNPAYPFDVEGDIHVWPGDHISWTDIEARLKQGNVERVVSEDYLVFSADYPPEVYEAFRHSCSDMRLLIGRKQ